MKKYYFLLTIFLLAKIGLAQINVTTYEQMPPEEVEPWVNKRMENIKKGLKETVEMPLAVRSLGWGCQCPMHYIGVGTTVKEGPWIAPVFPDDFTGAGDEGLAIVVTGYFSGQWITEDLRNANGEPAEWLYKMPEFIVTSWKFNDLDYQVAAPRIMATEKTKPQDKTKKKKSK